MEVLLFGGRGWIASYLIPLMKKKGWNVTLASVRANDTDSVIKLLDTLKPNRVISCIGRVSGNGCNTIDYLEQTGKLDENICDNLFAPVALGLLCLERNIHYTYIGTGCIFNDLNKTYNENDIGDFTGSAYSTVKGYTDRLMKLLEKTTLNVRIRLPISDDLHSKNFITKLIKYEKICSVSNSVSVLPSLMPILINLIEIGHIGTINLVNPNSISHNKILEMYKNTVDKNKTWSNYSIEEQDKNLASKRSNCVLNTEMLEALYPNIQSSEDAIQECLDKIAKI